MMKIPALFCLLVSTPALASDWAYVGESSDGTILYVDMDSIQRGKIEGHAWVEFDYSRVKSIKHRSSKELWKFNCPEKTSLTAHWIDYSANGNVIKSGTPTEYSKRFYPVAPDTFGEMVMDLVCAETEPEFDPSKQFETEEEK